MGFRVLKVKSRAVLYHLTRGPQSFMLVFKLILHCKEKANEMIVNNLFLLDLPGPCKIFEGANVVATAICKRKSSSSFYLEVLMEGKLVEQIRHPITHIDGKKGKVG